MPKIRLSYSTNAALEEFNLEQTGRPLASPDAYVEGGVEVDISEESLQRLNRVVPDDPEAAILKMLETARLRGGVQ
jgi:hypothetical protein